MVTHSLDITRDLEEGTHGDGILFGHIENHGMGDVVGYLFVQIIHIFLSLVDRLLLLFVIIKDCLYAHLDIISGHY